MLEAVGFVPAGGEDVEGDLAADRVAVECNGWLVRYWGAGGWARGLGKGHRRQDVRETIVAELFLQGFDELGPDVVLFVVFLVLVSFFDAGVTADGGDVDHAVSRQ